MKFLLTVMVVLIFSACADEIDSSEFRVDLIHGREGEPISVPAEINTIVSIGPAITDILVAIGEGNKIVAADFTSTSVSSSIAVLDMMSVDVEHIIALAPDIVLATSMIRTPGAPDPLSLVESLGISVIFIPMSESIASIMEDIRFIADIMGVAAAGETIVNEMEAEIEAVRAVSAGISSRRTVYFEISPAPWMFSFGSGTFQHEILEITGAENIFGHIEGWLAVDDESLLPLNPDVILTSVDFIDDPVSEIMSRAGFDTITAVQNNAVFQVSNDNTSQPSHMIILGIREIARAVYPEYFE